MKRLAIALALGTAVFAAVFAAAATLGLTTDQLGAGDQAVSSCDSSVNVTYQTDYSATLGTYRVSSITLTGLDEAQCAGQTITAVLTGAANASLAENDYSCCTTGDGTSEVLTVIQDVNPELVLGVHVVITGVNPP